MPHYMSYDGTALHYRILGGEGEAADTGALMCLAGGPARDAAYLGDLGGLSAGRPLVVPDFRGTGGSPLPPDPAACTFLRLAEDVEQLRRHLWLDRFTLVAHDAAAATAQAYAAAHPGHLARLVLLNPGSRLQGGLPHDAAEIFASRAAAEEWGEEARAALRLLRQTSDMDRVRALLRQAAPMAYGQWRAPQQAHAATEGEQLNPVPRAAFWQGIGEAERKRMLERLAEVRVPVLVVTGELDTVTGTRAGELVAASFPGAVLHCMPGVGHYPWIDAPGELARLVCGFLQEEELRAVPR